MIRDENRRGNTHKYTDDEIETMLDIRNLDEYDQALMELKNLVNEKKKFPKNSKSYDIAIEKLISGINEWYEEGDLPRDIVERDINTALKGGKYRILVKNTKEYPDIEIRRKKFVKSKSKRKVIKKSKGCGCK